MTETASVTRILVGQPIPEWLIVFEPRKDVPPGLSRRGNPRFSVDVDVVETEAVYFVVAVGDHRLAQLIDVGDMTACTAWAATKPVKIVLAWESMYPEEKQVGLQPMVEIPGFGQKPAAGRVDVQHIGNAPGAGPGPGYAYDMDAQRRPAPPYGEGGPVLNPQGRLPDCPSKWPERMVAKTRRPWWKRLFS